MFSETELLKRNERRKNIATQTTYRKKFNLKVATTITVDITECALDVTARQHEQMLFFVVVQNEFK